MSLDFEKLKQTEKDWKLTEEQRQRIAVNCLKHPPKFPRKKIAQRITVGVTFAAAVAAVVLVVLFMPPQKQPEVFENAFVDTPVVNTPPADEAPEVNTPPADEPPEVNTPPADETPDVETEDAPDPRMVFIYEDQIIHDFGKNGCIYRTIFGTSEKELLAENADILTVAGNKLLFTHDGWLCSMELDETPHIQKLTEYTGYYNCLEVWDGYALMQSRDYDNDIYYADLVDLKTMEVKKYDLNGYVSSMTWLDGAMYYVEWPKDLSAAQRVMAYSADSGESQLLFTYEYIPDHRADFFKADQRLYFFEHHNLMCYDLETGQMQSVMENAYLNQPSHAYFDGHIYINDRGMEDRIWIYDIEKQEVVSHDPMVLSGFYYSEYGVVYSHDYFYTTMISKEGTFTIDGRQLEAEKQTYSHAYGGAVGKQGYVQIVGNVMYCVSGPDEYTVLYRY